LEEEKERLCGCPGYQQEGTGCYRQHDERPEMIIVRLPAQWAFFFHGFVVASLRLSQFAEGKLAET
jgi:hypothetical protein